MSYPARNSHPAFDEPSSSSRPPPLRHPPSPRDCPINSFHIYDLHIARFAIYALRHISCVSSMILNI